MGGGAVSLLGTRYSCRSQGVRGGAEKGRSQCVSSLQFTYV